MISKRKIINLIKNAFGATTNRKLVAFLVDDWGSVRTRDKKAVEYLKSKQIDIDKSRFSRFDSLASESDLCALFDTLQSVKDKNGNYACFTAVMNPCNPNFEAIRNNHFTEFVSEPFTDTLHKYGYTNVFDLWQEGIAEKIFYPVFHGTEHVSRSQLMKSLQTNHPPDRWAFECDTVGVPGSLNGIMQPCYVKSANDNEAIIEVLLHGLDVFEELFGFPTRYFKAGDDVISPAIYPTLKDFGVKYMDEPIYMNRYLGDGKTKRCFAFTGKTNHAGQRLLVRNCMFEPTVNLHVDAFSHCLQMINAAFTMKKPAIISSHRVNYVGAIDEKNREDGLARLTLLLKEMVKRYPEVEFVNACQLGEIVMNKVPSVHSDL